MLNRERTTTAATRTSELPFPCRSLVPIAFVAIVAVLLLSLGLATVATAQSSETITGRIVVLLQADGDMTLGFQPEEEERIFPELNVLPSNVRINVWESFSPVLHQSMEIGAIDARRLSDGRTEFAFTPTGEDRISPEGRFYWHRESADAQKRVGKWVPSTPITFTVAQVMTEVATEPTGGAEQRAHEAVNEAESDPIINRATQKNVIVARLFRLEDGQVDALTKHDYNDFGCPLSGEQWSFATDLPLLDCDDWTKAEWWDEYERYGAGWQWRTYINLRTGQLMSRKPQAGYLGGHSGWDVRMRTHDNDWFYALTAGVVTKGKQETSSFGLIGIYDGESRTTLYLHSSGIHSFVQNGAIVEPGDCLGREGDTGAAKGAYHIHVELISGWARVGSGGARWLSNATIRGEDPVDYLYDWVSRTTARQPDCDSPASVAPPPIDGIKSGDRISLQGNNDQYLIWVRNGKWYKRLLINLDVLQSYEDDWPSSDLFLVTKSQFDSIPTSTLVRNYHGNAPQKIYHLTSDLHENMGTRHWLSVSGSEFDSAGFDWDSVFPVSVAEFEMSNYRLGPPLNVQDLAAVRRQQGGQ